MLHVTPESAAPLRALVAWFQRLRAGDPLEGLDPSEAARIAADLAINVDDLVSVAHQSADEAELMTRMMAVHGIDRAKLEAEMPQLVRAMAVTCANCTCKGECADDLAHGHAQENAPRYCPNTDSIASLTGR